ncbi:MAG: 50S ribosomal protein L10 [Thermoplasmata archaeon]
MNMVSQQKMGLVNDLVKMISEYDVVGIVGIRGIPGTQINTIRRTLRGNAKIVVSKNNYISLALKEAAKSKNGLEKLTEHISDQTGLILGNTDPFKLSKIISKSKTKAAAKGGEIAEEDIEVHEGETQFKPGPIVSDFQKVGIPAAIEKGKVVIKKEQKVVSKGEVISKDMAQMLSKLEIFPVTIGLDLKAIYEEGIVYNAEALMVDSDKTLELLRQTSMYGTSLALNIGYFTKSTVPIFLANAHREALSLAVSSKIYSSESIAILLQQANLSMMTLNKMLENKNGG